MILGLKGQRSRSQGHKVQKHIEGDRVASVSYVLYLVIDSMFIICNPPNKRRIRPTYCTTSVWLSVLYLSRTSEHNVLQKMRQWITLAVAWTRCNWQNKWICWYWTFNVWALISLVDLTFDLLTSKLVHWIPVWWASVLPILGFLGLSVHFIKRILFTCR